MGERFASAPIVSLSPAGLIVSRNSISRRRYCSLTRRNSKKRRHRSEKDWRVLGGGDLLDDAVGGTDLDAIPPVHLCLDFSVSRMHGSSGCLGSCIKPTPVTAVDEPSKGLKIQGRTVDKQGLSEDFWSTSTIEMENSAMQSMRSISSISTSTQAQDHHGVASTSNPKFVNHGLLLWNQTRQQWTGSKKAYKQPQKIREPSLSWNATYDSLLLNSKPFQHPVPLSEMIDFLVEVWEQDGLYD